MKTLLNRIKKSKLVTDGLIRVRRYKHLSKSRRALAKLNDEMLNDIGITRAEAEKEAAKPFWKSDSALFDIHSSESMKIKQRHCSTMPTFKTF